MNVTQYLIAAGVPQHLHADAQRSIDEARERSRGLAWRKWKVRLFKAGKIADILDWADERLIDKRPDLADWDIAPMGNITAHGDNVPWMNGRPAPGAWLNQDRLSAEYQQAVAANYWCEGTHPRSRESRKAWYRRNGGEYLAWSLGAPVALEHGVSVWSANGVTVHHCNGAWEVNALRKLVGPLNLRVRVGYEIDNVFHEGVAQFWYPIANHDLRAPVTWYVMPTFSAK